MKKLIVGGALVAAAGALTLTACTETEEPKSKPQTQTETPEEHGLTKSENKPEIADLIDYELVERDGDVYVEYDIKNHGDYRADYDITIEVLNSNGDRIANLDDGWFYVENVAPGQTVHGDQITFLETSGDDSRVADFDRTRG